MIPLRFDPFYTDSEYNNLRRLKCMMIGEKLNEYKEFKVLPYEEQIDIIKKIENSCLNESIRKAKNYGIKCIWEEDIFENVYHSIIYNILPNIDVNNEHHSDLLVKKIINNTIDLTTIASLTCKELMPERYQEINEEIYKRINTEQSVKYTEMFQCRRCKRKQTRVESIQFRAGDEGSNLRITCMFCNNQWIK